jgi:hypothetical protein
MQMVAAIVLLPTNKETMMKSFVVFPRLLVGLLSVLPTESHTQWQSDVRLTNAINSSYVALNGRPIATDITKVHVVWFDYRDASIYGGEGVNIYYKKSTNNGGDWSSDVKIVDDVNNSFDPSIGVYQNNIHVVWYDDRHGYYEIYYKRSTDDGLTWGSDVRLTNAVQDSEDPVLYVIGTSVHVVWSDWRDGNWEIYYKRSTNNGVNWTSDVRLTNSTGFSEHPQIVTTQDGQTIHVVWQDYRDGNYEIYYKRSTDGGVNWGSDTRLTNATGNSRWPSLAISGTTIHLTWTDNRTGTEFIYYKKSTNNGINWTSDVSVVDQMSAVSSIALSNNGQLVHLVWMDYRHGTNNSEIYYKRSVDAGASWEADARLTSNSADQITPGVAIGVQTVHVVWSDMRDGNWEIYYKRNPTGNILPVQLASFTATVVNGNSVRLDWRTISEVNNYGFEVQRALSAPTNFITLPGSFIPGHGTTNEPQVYTYLDQNVPSGRLYYRLKQIDLDGTIHYSDPISVDILTDVLEAPTPTAYVLQQNYPNPFNPSTKIKFSIPVGTEHAPSLLRVYDVLGREVATLVNESLPPGSYEVTFDAAGLASGVYFYRLTVGAFMQAKRMVLMR